MSTPNRSTVQWRKSSHSGPNGGQCVEVADLASGVGVRDSKNPDGPNLIIGSTAWGALARRIKAGAHDLP